MKWGRKVAEERISKLFFSSAQSLVAKDKELDLATAS